MKNQAPSSAALRKRRHQLVRGLPPIVSGLNPKTLLQCQLFNPPTGALAAPSTVSARHLGQHQ